MRARSFPIFGKSAMRYSRASPASAPARCGTTAKSRGCSPIGTHRWRRRWPRPSRLWEPDGHSHLTSKSRTAAHPTTNQVPRRRAGPLLPKSTRPSLPSAKPSHAMLASSERHRDAGVRLDPIQVPATHQVIGIQEPAPTMVHLRVPMHADHADIARKVLSLGREGLARYARETRGHRQIGPAEDTAPGRIALEG